LNIFSLPHDPAPRSRPPRPQGPKALISARSGARITPAHPSRIYAPVVKKSLLYQGLTPILPPQPLPDITSAGATNKHCWANI
jgi:hypothetical protein